MNDDDFFVYTCNIYIICFVDFLQLFKFLLKIKFFNISKNINLYL